MQMLKKDHNTISISVQLHFTNIRYHIVAFIFVLKQAHISFRRI